MEMHPEQYVHMSKAATRRSISRHWSLCAHKPVRGAIGQVVRALLALASSGASSLEQMPV